MKKILNLLLIVVAFIGGAYFTVPAFADTINSLPQYIITKNEGVQLTPRTTQYNFVGAGVDATNVGNVVTVTIGGGGTAGGLDTELQYNNAGAFGGITGVTSNGTKVNFETDTLEVKNIILNNGTFNGIITSDGLTDNLQFGIANVGGATSAVISAATKDGNLTVYELPSRGGATGTFAMTDDIPAALTFSTGLTDTAGTITSNLSTGIAGGQSVIGGTDAVDDLTLSSTSNGTKGSIFFGTSAYDEVNNRLGIGTTSPSARLSVSGEVTVSSYINATSGYYGGNTNAGMNTNLGNDILSFRSGGSDNRMVIIANGNVGIGQNTPGAKLNILATTEQLRLEHTSGTRYMTTTVASTGTTTFDLVGSSPTFIMNKGLDVNGVFTGGDFNDITTANGRAAIGGGINHTASGMSVLNMNGSLSGTTGAQVNMVNASMTVFPSSGSNRFVGFNYAPTLNQTGTATGITNALYIAPTFTAAADFRAIEAYIGNREFLRAGFDTSNYITGITTSVGATTFRTAGTTQMLSLGTTNRTYSIVEAASSSGFYQWNSGSGTASAVGSNFAGTWNASSGINPIVAISPVINQTSTAGYTALKINVTETGTGSGTKRLIEAQVGGSNIFTVSNTGLVNISSLDTDLTAPTTSGTTKMVITDSNGLLSFDDIPSGGGLTWTEVTGTSQAAAINNGYIANNAALVTITLPTTAPVGSIVRVTGVGAGGWKIAQNASEQIIWNEGGVDGTDETTIGTGGYLASTDDYDSVELVCLVANTTWGVLSVKGNITLN